MPHWQDEAPLKGEHKLMNSGIKEAERIIAEQKADTKV